MKGTKNKLIRKKIRYIIIIVHTDRIGLLLSGTLFFLKTRRYCAYANITDESKLKRMGSDARGTAGKSQRRMSYNGVTYYNIIYDVDCRIYNILFVYITRD